MFLISEETQMKSDKVPSNRKRKKHIHQEKGLTLKRLRQESMEGISPRDLEQNNSTSDEELEEEIIETESDVDGWIGWKSQPQNASSRDWIDNKLHEIKGHNNSNVSQSKGEAFEQRYRSRSSVRGDSPMYGSETRQRSRSRSPLSPGYWSARYQPPRFRSRSPHHDRSRSRSPRNRSRSPYQDRSRSHSPRFRSRSPEYEHKRYIAHHCQRHRSRIPDLSDSDRSISPLSDSRSSFNSSFSDSDTSLDTNMSLDSSNKYHTIVLKAKTRQCPVPKCHCKQKVFRNVDQFLDHWEDVHHPRPIYACSNCPFVATMDMLHRHYINGHHIEEAVVGSHMETSRKGGCMGHIPPIIDSGKFVVKHSSLKQFVYFHPDKLACPVPACKSRQFTTAKEVVDHWKCEHEPEPMGQEYFCNFYKCTFGAESLTAIQNHYKEEHKLEDRALGYHLGKSRRNSEPAQFRLPGIQPGYFYLRMYIDTQMPRKKRSYVKAKHKEQKNLQGYPGSVSEYRRGEGEQASQYYQYYEASQQLHYEAQPPPYSHGGSLGQETQDQYYPGPYNQVYSQAVGAELPGSVATAMPSKSTIGMEVKPPGLSTPIRAAFMPPIQTATFDKADMPPRPVETFGPAVIPSRPSGMAVMSVRPDRTFGPRVIPQRPGALFIPPRGIQAIPYVPNSLSASPGVGIMGPHQVADHLTGSQVAVMGEQHRVTVAAAHGPSCNCANCMWLSKEQRQAAITIHRMAVQQTQRQGRTTTKPLQKIIQRQGSKPTKPLQKTIQSKTSKPTKPFQTTTSQSKASQATKPFQTATSQCKTSQATKPFQTATSQSKASKQTKPFQTTTSQFKTSQATKPFQTATSPSKASQATKPFQTATSQSKTCQATKPFQTATSQSKASKQTKPFQTITIQNKASKQTKLFQTTSTQSKAIKQTKLFQSTTQSKASQATKPSQTITTQSKTSQATKPSQTITTQSKTNQATKPSQSKARKRKGKKKRIIGQYKIHGLLCECSICKHYKK